MAWELWRLASGCGQTPWDALRDPHFAFNMTVMRGALKAEDVTFRMAMEASKHGDEFGVGRVITGLHRLTQR